MGFGLTGALIGGAPAHTWLVGPRRAALYKRGGGQRHTHHEIHRCAAATPPTPQNPSRSGQSAASDGKIPPPTPPRRRPTSRPSPAKAGGDPKAAGTSSASRLPRHQHRRRTRWQPDPAPPRRRRHTKVCRRSPSPLSQSLNPRSTRGSRPSLCGSRS